MKYSLIVLLLVSVSAWSKTPARDLSKELEKDMQKELQKDDDKFRTVSRMPASVQPVVEPRIDETPKLDKNIRQIGPNKW